MLDVKTSQRKCWVAFTAMICVLPFECDLSAGHSLPIIFKHKAK